MLLDLLHRHPGPPAGTARRRGDRRGRRGRRPASLRRTCPRLTLPFGDAQQLVVVTTPTWSSTTGTLNTYEKVDGRGRTSSRAPGPPRPQWPQRRPPRGRRHDAGRLVPDRRHHGPPAEPRRPLPVPAARPRRLLGQRRRLPIYNPIVRATPCVTPNEDMYPIGAGAYRYAATIGYNVTRRSRRRETIFLHRHSTTRKGARSRRAAASRSRRPTCWRCCAGWIRPCTRASSWARTPG